MGESLPTEIVSDLSNLNSGARSLGFETVRGAVDPAHFGNFMLDITGPTRSVRIIRDRLQYFVEGDREELERAGLFRAFDDRGEFERAVLAWLGARA